MSRKLYGEQYNVNTAIAFSFYDLGLCYEKRCNYDLAIENYKKCLDYDKDLKFVRNALGSLLQFIHTQRMNTTSAVNVVLSEG